MTQPWQRQRNEDTDELEPMLWYSRFSLYLEMGTKRTLLGTANKYRVSEGQSKSNYIAGSWRNAAEKWNWKQRAEAWDAAELERIAVEFREDCDEWRRERFKDSRKLRERARFYLDWTQTEVTGVDENQRRYTVKPVSTAMLKDAAAILKVADELARITTRETLPKVEVEQSGGVTITYAGNVDPEEV